MSDERGFTGLWEAVATGNTEKVKFHLRGSVNINSQQKGRTPIHLAVEKNRPKAVELLIAHRVNINAYSSSVTPLYVAAFAGFLECVQVLLHAGANPSARCKNNTDYPLLAAAERGHSEIVKLLLEHGALVNVTRPQGMAALHLALLGDHKKVVEYLLTYGEGVDVSMLCNGFRPLHLIAIKDDSWIPLLELMLSKPHNINCKRPGRNTPLHDAVSSSADNPLICRRFLGYADIDVSTQNAQGHSALTLACQAGKAQCVDMILDLAPWLINSTPGAESPLQYALKAGHHTIAVSLVNRGADLFFKAYSYYPTPLEMAGKPLGDVLKQCWESFHEGWKKALDDPMLSDIVFRLPKSDRQIRAARVVLSYRCQHFKQFLESPEVLPSGQEAGAQGLEVLEVVLADAQYQPFFLFLSYLYTDSIDTTQIRKWKKEAAEKRKETGEKKPEGGRLNFRVQLLSDLLILAEKYGVMRLQRLCIKSMEDASTAKSKKQLTKGEKENREVKTKKEIKNFMELRSSFAADMRKAVGSPTFSDVKFVVGEKKQILCAHKAVLCARNEYFRALLLGPWGQTGEPIPTDNAYHIFKAILIYCYTGECPTLDGGNVVEMYEASHQYLILELRNQCEILISDAIGIDNVTHICRLAHLYQDANIMTKARQFILRDTETFRLVSNRSDFLVLEKGLLQDIYTALLIQTGAFKVPSGIYNLVDLRNNKGRSPLQVAARSCGMSVCVQYLLDSGADISETTVKKANTVLHLACAAGDLLTVRVLCKDPGVNISAKNVKGDTPLHVACRRGEQKIAEVLVENGAELSVVNNKNEAPLQLVSAIHGMLNSTLPELRTASKLQFGDLFNSPLFSDVIFQTETEKLYAHKVILYARCPFFSEIFADCTASDEIVHPTTGTRRVVSKVELDGIDAKVMRLFLEYVYKDEVVVPEDVVYELLSVATIYPMERLQRVCQRVFEEVEIPSSQITTDLATCVNSSLFADVTFVFLPSDDDDEFSLPLPTMGGEFDIVSTSSEEHSSKDKRKTLVGHSCILASRCPSLLDRFGTIREFYEAGADGQGNGMIEIDMGSEDCDLKCTFESLKVLLRYLYCGLAHLPSGGEDQGLVEEVKELAAGLGVKELVRQCNDLLEDIAAQQKRAQFLTAF